MNKSTNASRLGGFAAGHFGLSLLCYIAMMSSGLLWASMGENMAVALVFMIFYFPVGMLMGAAAPWARVSTLRELGRAVVSQVGIAWIWGGLVLMAVFVPWTLAVLVWLVFPTPILAAPSSYFVLCAAGLAGTTRLSNNFLVWLAAMLAAGLLPPLLYNLGNFCVGRGKVAEMQGEQQDRRADT